MNLRHKTNLTQTRCILRKQQYTAHNHNYEQKYNQIFYIPFYCIPILNRWLLLLSCPPCFLTALRFIVFFTTWRASVFTRFQSSQITIACFSLPSLLQLHLPTSPTFRFISYLIYNSVPRTTMSIND